jgi:hypothetical protein
MPQPRHTRAYWNLARERGERAQSLRYVMFVTLRGFRIRSRPDVPITGVSERRHEPAVMCQIPAELGWSARFSPNRRFLRLASCLLSNAKCVGYTPQ